MAKAVVDRFEGDFAVLIAAERSEPLVVPRQDLPEEVREGDHLDIDMRDDAIIAIRIDAEATAAAQQRIQEKLNRLRRGDHLRDDP